MRASFEKIKQKIFVWDKTISSYISENFSKENKKVAKIYAKSGNVLPWLVFSLVCFIFNIIIPRTELLIQWLAMGATFLLVMIMKFLIRRKRPVEEIPEELVGKVDIYSFPSGHAGRMSCLAVIMLLLFPKTGWIFIIWAIFVGVGRIATEIHYFFDILGGTVVGGSVGSIFYLLRNELEQFFEPIISWMNQILF